MAGNNMMVTPRRGRIVAPWHHVPYPSWKWDRDREVQRQAAVMSMIATMLRAEALRLVPFR